MDKALHGLLDRIANAVGEPTRGIDTDHGRWHLYECAIKASVALDLLQQAVALEEDRALATTVVLRMLELVADDRQADWISQLAPDNRTYSEKRAAEIRILRRAKAGELAAGTIAEEIAGWTDWLQIRLAEAMNSRDGLSIVSAQGRTKRIRNTAAGRVKTLSA